MANDEIDTKLDEIWADDLLGRRQNAEFLEIYLNKKHSSDFSHLDRKSLVVNLKGDWGTGKSFFLRRFAKHLRTKGHVVAEVNAWKADPEVDPVVSMVASIQEEIDRTFPNKKMARRVKHAFSDLKQKGGAFALTAVKGGMRRVGKLLIDDAYDQIGDTFNSIAEPDPNAELGIQDVSGWDQADISEVTDKAIDAALDSKKAQSVFNAEIKMANKRSRAISAFSSSLEKLASEVEKLKSKSAPIYVFVDELDRCNPLFSILFLERIVHLFDSKGIVFLIGSDSDELQHSICAVYGEKFDAKTYLERFFSFTYRLGLAGRKEFCAACIAELGLDEERYHGFNLTGANYLESYAEVLAATDLTLRELKQHIFLASVFEDLWYFGLKIDLLWMIAAIFIVQFNFPDDVFRFSEENFIPETRSKFQGLNTIKIAAFYRDGERKEEGVRSYFNRASRAAFLPLSKFVTTTERSSDAFDIQILRYQQDVPLKRLPVCKGKFLFYDYLVMLRSAENINIEV